MYFDGEIPKAGSRNNIPVSLACLFAMCALLVGPLRSIAQSAKGRTQSEADLAWVEVTKAGKPLHFPEAWKTKPPSAKDMEEFRQTQRAWAAHWGEAAAAFYYRYPDHRFAENARLAHLSALQAAWAFGDKTPSTRCDEIEKLLAKTNLPENDRFNLRWECAIRSAVSKRAVNQEAMIQDLEQSARSLQKDFPNKTDSQALLAAAGSRRESKKKPGSEFVKGAFLAEAKQGAENHVEKNEAKQRTLDTDLTTIDGKKIRLGSLQGKVVLLHFWTSGAPMGGSNFDLLKKVDDKYRGKGIELVSINFDPVEQKGRTVLQRESPSWAQVIHGRGSSATPWRDLGVEYLPSIWLLDKEGFLRDEHAVTDLMAKVEGLMGKP